LSQSLKIEAVSAGLVAGRGGLFIKNRCGGGVFAHHDAVSDRVVRGLVYSVVGPSLLLLNHFLKISRLRACNSPVTLLFADAARGWIPASLVSMSMMSQRWLIILVAAILLLMKKSLVQILEAPLAGFTRISRESFQVEEGTSVEKAFKLKRGLKYPPPAGRLLA